MNYSNIISHCDSMQCLPNNDDLDLFLQNNSPKDTHPPPIQLCKNSTYRIAAPLKTVVKERRLDSSRFSITKNRELVKLPFLQGLMNHLLIRPLTFSSLSPSPPSRNTLHDCDYPLNVVYLSHVYVIVAVSM